MTSVKRSAVLDMALCPAFGSSRNIFLASTTFTNWNLFPFDTYTLKHSGQYLEGKIRVSGVRSPRGSKSNLCVLETVKENLIVSNVSDIKPSDALTPSLEPMSAKQNDAEMPAMDLLEPMTAERQSNGMEMMEMQNADLMDDENDDIDTDSSFEDNQNEDVDVDVNEEEDPDDEDSDDDILI